MTQLDVTKWQTPKPAPEPDRTNEVQVLGRSVKVHLWQPNTSLRQRFKVDAIKPPCPRVQNLNTNYDGWATFPIREDQPIEVAYDAAIKWLEMSARAATIAEAAIDAMQNEPDYVANSNDHEPWYELARQCVDIHVSKDDCPVREGQYTIDITPIMDSSEVGPNMGGVATIEFDEGDVLVRCDLVLCLSPALTGDKWLAVYEVSHAY